MAQWSSAFQTEGRGFEPHWRRVSLSKNINSSFELVQYRKTHPYIVELLLMGRKNQIKQTKHI